MNQQSNKLHKHLSYIPEQFSDYDNPFFNPFHWEYIAKSFKYSDEMQTLKELKESIDSNSFSW